jgi:hypothetical protein
MNERRNKMDFGIASVAAITVIVYIVGMLVKASPLADKWIPSICGVVGGALGIASMFIMPEFPAQDVISAFAVGIVSGLASTGADQMVKQIRKEE